MLDVLHRQVSLKHGKAAKVTDKIEVALRAKAWVIKDIQSIVGNTV